MYNSTKFHYNNASARRNISFKIRSPVVPVLVETGICKYPFKKIIIILSVG